MKIMNRKEVQFILRQLKVTPKKSLGQNFLIDLNILQKIISEANLNKNDVVVEIGTGLGIITSELISKVKKVYSYEINSKLFQYASQKFSGLSNIELFNEDILQVEIPYHNKIVSNIPYTLTGPIFEKIFYKETPPEGVLIIEKSIANRIFFSGTYKDFSRITVTFNAFMTPIKMRNVSSNSFFPRPNIDLSLVKVRPRDTINSFLLKNENLGFFLNFIAGVMPYKNKNILNALELFFKNNNSYSLTRKELLEFLKEYKIKNIKLFQFNIDNLINLSAQMFKWLKK